MDWKIGMRNKIAFNMIQMKIDKTEKKIKSLHDLMKNSLQLRQMSYEA